MSPRSLALPVFTVCVLAAPTLAQEQHSFEPFDSIEGTLEVNLYYDTAPGSPCTDAGHPVGDGEETRSMPFTYYQGGTVEADAVEFCTVHYARASVAGSWWRDLIESRPPDYITSGHEWSFTFFAEAHPIAGAAAKATIEFTLNRPCLVSFHAQHSGRFFASLEDIQNENYYPSNGTIIDFDHYDTQILGPGPHTLRASAIPFVDRSVNEATNATLWVRFDDAYCSPADLAEPFGMHDGSDILAFIGHFLEQGSAADLNGDGVVDLADIQAFVGYFLGGCVEEGAG